MLFFRTVPYLHCKQDTVKLVDNNKKDASYHHSDIHLFMISKLADMVTHYSNQCYHSVAYLTYGVDLIL